MSLTPSTPNLKSFWEKPEGKTGMVVATALIAAGAYGLFIALPFIITLLTNVIYAAYLGVALFVIGYVVLSGKFQTLLKFVFQSVMRKLTGFFIELDPIGILKNIIAELKNTLAIMSQQISSLSGAIRQLTDTIDKNAEDARHSLALAAEAKRQLDKGVEDKAREYQLTLQMSNKAAHSGRLTKNNQSLEQLRAKLKVLYDLLIRTQTTAQAYIEDKEDRVREETIRRKAVKQAFGAYRSALAILRGNPDQNALYDQTMEYLAEDAGQKLGEMEDFGRIAGEFIANMDLETGAVQQQALAQLEAFEQRLLAPAAVDGEYMPSMPTKKNDYADIVK